jgi:hypothetical protein
MSENSRESIDLREFYFLIEFNLFVITQVKTTGSLLINFKLQTIS